MPFDVAAVEALAVAAAGVFSDGFQELATSAVREVNAEHARLAEEQQRLEEVRAHIGDLLEQLAADRQSFEEEKQRQIAVVQFDTEAGKLNDVEHVTRCKKGTSQRIPLEELSIGNVMTGKVSRCGTSNIFVDIGAVRDAQLRLPKPDAQVFRRGDVLDSVVIVNIDLEKQEVRLRLDGDRSTARADALGSRRRRRAESSPPPLLDRGSAAVVAAAADSRLSSGAPTLCEEDLVQNHHHHSAKPIGRQTNTQTSCVTLEELKIGNTVSGIVMNTGPSGVFLDFGATKPGKLKAAKNETKRFKVGDYVQAVIEGLDLDKGHFVVAPVDSSRPQAPRPRPAASPTRLAAGPQAARPVAAPCWEPSLAAAVASPAAANGGEVRVRSPSPRPNRNASTVGLVEPQQLSNTDPSSVGQMGGVATTKSALGRANPRRRLASRSPDRLPMRDGDAATQRRSRRHRLPSPTRDAIVEGATPGGKPIESVQSKTTKAQRNQGQQEVLQLEKIAVGDEVSGTVTSCDASGMWIDFGGKTDGLLRVSVEEAKMFQLGDHLGGLLVDEILVNPRRVLLRYPTD